MASIDEFAEFAFELERLGGKGAGWFVAERSNWEDVG